jgi:hypothetical protein
MSNALRAARSDGETPGVEREDAEGVGSDRRGGGCGGCDALERRVKSIG